MGIGITRREWERIGIPLRQTYGYLPSRRTSLPFDRYQFLLLGKRGYSVCEQLAQNHYPTAERPEVEEATCKLQVHYTGRSSNH